MSLTILGGPANSGKTGEVLDRFTASLEGEPVLVLPTRADVERFEQELVARVPVALGGRVVTFQGLVRLAAEATGTVGPPPLTASQRQVVIAATVAETELTTLREPSLRSGFPAALDAFIDELQSALVEPDALTQRSRSGDPASGGHSVQLAALYAGYIERRDGLGRSDAHVEATAAAEAVLAEPAGWARRPVFIHGFDDLTAEQLRLVGALARGAEVLVSVVREEGRACLAARERLMDRLEEVASAASTESVERIQLPAERGAGVLSHLERSFLTEAAERVAPEGRVVLLEAAGPRNEVEQVAAEVVELLRSGVRPEQIAVISRSPDQQAGLVDQVFRAYGVPAAIDAELALGQTAVGRGLIALLRAALPAGSAADLLAYLRASGRAPGAVDRLERSVRVNRLGTADAVATAWSEHGRGRLAELEGLRAAAREGTPALAEHSAALARRLFERRHRRAAPLLAEAEREDQLAAEAAARALDEIAELARLAPRLVPDGERIIALLEALRVRRFSGNVAGRVEVISPYRARARRFEYTFVLSLQEGEFPRRPREDPFLAEDERLRAGMPARVDQRDEERYLFYVCLSRSTRRLYLSCRTTDDDGVASTPSFFVDDVLDLLQPDDSRRQKGVADVVFEPRVAPTERGLARALAARRESGPPPRLGAAPALAARLRSVLEPALAHADRLPGSLTVPVVREHFAARKLIGASSLEQYAECPFRYFIGHELHPRRLAPAEEPLARGSAVHSVLERLYEEVGDRPRPETVEWAVARAKELLRDECAGGDLGREGPEARAAYRRMESDLTRFIRYDAAHPTALPVYKLEAAFGGDEASERPPLELDGFALHGKIDRIDGAEGRDGFIRDYKTGRTVASRKDLGEEKKLQLPLYMLALRELWGMEPLGGVYHPLGNQESQAPRGVLRGPVGSLDGVVGDELKKTDYTDSEEEFEELLRGARRDAEEIARKIQTGYLDRDPIGGSCPSYCDFHAICRRERGQKKPEQQEAAAKKGSDG